MDEVPIEVEYKFIIPADIKERLAYVNATLSNESTFTDIYYDTEDYALSLTDTWLRTRNGKYQLKYAPPNRLKSDVYQYKETDDLQIIESHVYRILNESSECNNWGDGSSDLANLKPFAELTTHRTKYTLDGVTIDLDQTDFGYSIGEIEIVSKSEDELQGSIDEVKHIMTLLKVEMVNSTTGKLMTYLSIHNKTLRDKLYEKFHF